MLKPSKASWVLEIFKIEVTARPMLRGTVMARQYLWPFGAYLQEAKLLGGPFCEFAHPMFLSMQESGFGGTCQSASRQDSHEAFAPVWGSVRTGNHASR